MKITYVIDSIDYLTGGTERQLYLLIQGIVSRGHRVELYLLRETSFTAELNNFPCPVRCLGIGSLGSLATLRSLWSFRKALLLAKVDAVHGFFNDVALILPPLLMLTGIKVFTSRRDMGIWYSGMRLFILRLFRFSRARLLCNSQAVAQFSRRKEWKPWNAIKVVYNGIEPLSIFSGGTDCVWAPKRGGRDWAPIKVVLVANVRSVKRIEDLVMAAASILYQEKTGIQFYVIGILEDKSYFESLLLLLRRHQLEDNFHFVGALAEPRRCLRWFDIGVLTSASEGFSNSVLEYLDAGLPVIASRVGGNPEVICNGYNGFLYQLGNIDELADCIGKLATDADLRRFMGENAKRSAQRFNIRTMIEAYEKIYISA